MKALNRKEALVNAKANGTLDSFKPLTREEAFTKKALELGGGASSWNDLTDKPFYEERHEYFMKIKDDTYELSYIDKIEALPGIHPDWVLTFEIRGDIYENVGQVPKKNYYDCFTWGSFDDYSVEYPFWMIALHKMGGDSLWDDNGNYIGIPEAPDGQYATPQMEFSYDPNVYPNLDIETEVKIYRTVLKPIDTKYLPSNVITATIDWDGDYPVVTGVDKTRDEIIEMLTSGQNIALRSGGGEDGSWQWNYYQLNYDSYLIGDEVGFQCAFTTINKAANWNWITIWLYSEDSEVFGEYVEETIVEDTDKVIVYSSEGKEFEIVVGEDGTLSTKSRELQ